MRIVCSGVSGPTRMPSFTADHPDDTVGQFGQRDVATSWSRHRRVSVESPRLPRSTDHAVAPLLPPGKAAGNGKLRSGSAFEKQTGVELLRAGDSARVWDGVDGERVAQCNDVWWSTTRRARTVHVEYERDQRAGRRTDDAENSRQIYHQLPRLLMSIIDREFEFYEF